jgi:hypothetical protein
MMQKEEDVGRTASKQRRRKRRPHCLLAYAVGRSGLSGAVTIPFRLWVFKKIGPKGKRHI